MKFFCPPAALQGRAGAARLRTGDMDVLVAASCFAPASTKKCGETAKRLCSWVESIYDKHGKPNHAMVDDRPFAGTSGWIETKKEEW